MMVSKTRGAAWHELAHQAGVEFVDQDLRIATFNSASEKRSAGCAAAPKAHR